MLYSIFKMRTNEWSKNMKNLIYHLLKFIILPITLSTEFYLLLKEKYCNRLLNNVLVVIFISIIVIVMLHNNKDDTNEGRCLYINS